MPADRITSGCVLKCSTSFNDTAGYPIQWTFQVKPCSFYARQDSIRRTDVSYEQKSLTPPPGPPVPYPPSSGTSTHRKPSPSPTSASVSTGAVSHHTAPSLPRALLAPAHDADRDSSDSSREPVVHPYTKACTPPNRRRRSLVGTSRFPARPLSSGHGDNGGVRRAPKLIPISARSMGFCWNTSSCVLAQL